ncbi:TonB-dependent receptor domain-containing protein [Roseateles sp.]|uniref:TonB-dependent receptor domain-containing protein n=1 Tax=Roseateles sp. TaxID=1971397 RepID=UPI002E09BC93|nr:TonB-dependent receptor [Roseateles sp.]
MFKRNVRSAAALAMIGTLGAMGAAHAQEGDTQKLERIEITGTRIKSVGAESSSPILSVGKEDMSIKQPVAVEELLRGLPAAYPAIGPSINNGSNGTASIDLRGLGSNRTLVLINGRRFVPATLTGTVDTNAVPVSLLERVDLVTGGASAVYGADAVAGVVNFVTKRNFSGIEATTLYSTTSRGDGKRYKNDLTVGANLSDGRGNVVLHIGSTRTEPVRLGDRNYAGTVISSRTGLPGGYSQTAAPAVFQFPAPASATLSGDRVIDPATGLLRAGDGTTPPDGYNTNPPNYFETPLDRTQATALAYYRVNDNLEVYGDFFHNRSLVTLNLAPSGTFLQSFAVPIGNPYITPALRTQLCAAYGIAAANCVAGAAGTTEINMLIGRRFVEAGPRVYNYDNTSSQYTAGLRGDVPLLDGWSYDAYYQSGRADQQLTTGNGFSRSKVQQALRAFNTTSCSVTTGGCVPLNVFGQPGSITPEMLAFAAIPTFQTTRVDQRILAASVSGEVGVLKSPFARNPLSLALGYEDRKVTGGNASDNVVQTQGELLGSGSPTPDRSGVIKFKEAFVEANLPLAQDLPFVHSLNLGLGYRDTDFKTAVTSKTYNSWKAGLDWSPVRGLRFRGEQQRATRAPNVNELYAPVVTGLATVSADPCKGTAINAADAGKAGTLTNLCQQTGVPTGQIGFVPNPSASQAANTSGGNPNLGPEKADTTTIGLVWEPVNTAFSATLDYWRIKVTDAITAPTAGQVVDSCYNPLRNPGYSLNAFCQLIARNPTSGGLSGTGFSGINTQSSNQGLLVFSGVDVGMNYRFMLKAIGLDAGRLDFGLQLSLLDKADYKALPVLDTIGYAGHYGIDVGTPYTKRRFNQRTTWTYNDWTVGLAWRYIGESTVQTTGAANNVAGKFVKNYESIPDVNYFDLNVGYQVLKNLRVSVTINNLFDKQPPIVGTGIGPGASNYGNTFPSAYDVIGRRYTAALTASF